MFFSINFNTVLIFLSFTFYRCKERDIINGNIGKLKYVESNTLFLESSKGVLPVFPVFENGCQYYPFLVTYS